MKVGLSGGSGVKLFQSVCNTSGNEQTRLDSNQLSRSPQLCVYTEAPISFRIPTISVNEIMERSCGSGFALSGKLRIHV
jgi:hypothetical protein